MKHVLFFLSLICYTKCFSVRGYSTIWKNHENIIKKQVIYDHNTRLKHRLASELKEIEELEPGYCYKATKIPYLDKLIIKKIKVL